MRPPQRNEPDVETPAFAEVVAELLRPPYVWWLLVAMVLQAYAPLYIAPVAAAIAATSIALARQAVRTRRPEPVRDSDH
ncbi:MAG TPA: hypothetical protein VHE57_08725 [Mycobacteriales bacterium]|nr:hypothetical protein [Mycobacteriales bacterium]